MLAKCNLGMQWFAKGAPASECQMLTCLVSPAISHDKIKWNGAPLILDKIRHLELIQVITKKYLHKYHLNCKWITQLGWALATFAPVDHHHPIKGLYSYNYHLLITMPMFPNTDILYLFHIVLLSDLQLTLGLYKLDLNRGNFFWQFFYNTEEKVVTYTLFKYLVLFSPWAWTDTHQMGICDVSGWASVRATGSWT